MPDSPNLGAIYNKAAQTHGPNRNPVIVIPGILGSKLKDTETSTLVWGAFVKGAANPRTPEGKRLIGLPMQEGTRLGQLRDGVTSAGALDTFRLSIFGGFSIEQRAYINILSTLGVGGYSDQTLGEAGAVDYGDSHFTCFQFDYDWRRSCVENAGALGRFIKTKKQEIAEEYKRLYGMQESEIKFDIVAHSLGGLVARYYLRYGEQSLPADGSPPSITWAGTRDVEKVVLVATPNAGTPYALNQLTDGFQLSRFIPKFEAALLGTMPSIYELLQRPRHNTLTGLSKELPFDIYDPELWISKEWGLANPEQEKILVDLLPEIDDPARRRTIAIDHLRKCLTRAKRFHAAMDRPAKPPRGTLLTLYAGDAEETPAGAMVSRRSITLTQYEPGDGSVTRRSALMDERVGEAQDAPFLVSPIGWDDVNFIHSNHIGITRAPAFQDSLLFLLLEKSMGP